MSASATSRARGSGVPRFGVFEAALESAKEYANPLAEASAEAVLVRPDGAEWRIPLFWDGGRTWRFRVSPDLEGNWRYRVTSTDAGLNGREGVFRCEASSLHGALGPMKEFPHHFQYQDGTPVWLFGDTCWRLFCSNDEKKLNRRSVEHYMDVRAEQGFNYIHADLFGYKAEPAATNEGGTAFLDKGQERINPAYFREVDGRLRYLNERGIACGLIYAWGGGPVSWTTFRDDAARMRYARYVTARYAAFNVVLLVSGEWHYLKDRPDLFAALGREIRKADPHGRMIGIHPGPSIESNGDLADEPWMSFGEYLQAYSASGFREASDAQRDKLRRYVLGFRTGNKPVVNAEYAYFLRDQDGNGRVDKPHSHTREAFRRASWMMPMAGAYFVTGFGTTYFGGHRDSGPFDVDAERNRPAEADLAHLRRFFADLEWWRLAPAESLVAADGSGFAYCLADGGGTFVVYVCGASRATLDLAKSPVGGALAVKRYDPREGRFADAGSADGKTVVTLIAPDEQDWVFLVRPAGTD